MMSNALTLTTLPSLVLAGLFWCVRSQSNCNTRILLEHSFISHTYHKVSSMASVKVQHPVKLVDVDPAEVYGTSGSVKLRIATGGAGQSGLLRALAERFIQE